MKTETKYAKILGVERPEDPVRLDIKNLTLRISAKNGREDYLWEIGSGANWMGYHVAVMLSLHEYFLSLEESPVPNFVIFDQPSQVYFPETWPGVPDPKNRPPKDISAYSDDILRVHKIFEACQEAIRSTKNRLQVIVIDHADEITWKGIPDIHVAQRWRGTALIPLNW